MSGVKNLSDQNTALVNAASKHLEAGYEPGKHHVACALRCNDNIYTALHLDTRGFDVCAEPIAISNALAAGEKSFSSIVAVIKNGDKFDVVSPCGNCRQILLEYCPDIEVIAAINGRAIVVSPVDLLPWPYE